jgi:YVTN family beta-propeller protein
MKHTESRRAPVVRRAARALAIAALLGAAAVGPADAANGGPPSLAAGRPGPAVAVPTGFRPVSASFLSRASGFVLGGVGCAPGKACVARLVATTDGGARWHVVKAPAVRLSGLSAGGSVSGVVFASARVGWLYGPGLWSTRDGGAHWRKLALGGAVRQMAASAGRVYAVVAPPDGKPSELFVSPAGRDAWARVRHFTARFGILAVSGRAVWFGNGGGVFERSRPYVWATADGARWHKYPVRCPAPYDRDGLASIAAASPSDVFFLCLSDAGAGQQGKAVLRSVNGGRTAHLAGTAPTGGSGGVIALPPRRPRVITLGTEFFLDRSADGGKTWTTKYHDTGGAPWNYLSYLSRTAGWAEFGSPPGSGILRTTNAGLTWHQVRFATPPHPVTAYVVNAGSGTVTPINTATGKPLKAIRVGTNPGAIAITPNGRTAYVVNSGSGTVTPIRTATNKAGTAITVGKDPRYIAITPDGKTAYVVNYRSNTVTPIRTGTNKAGKAIKVGIGPGAIAITPDGKTAYVAEDGNVLGAPGFVAPILTATNTMGKAIKVGKDPGAIAITPDGKTAYVADEDYASGPPMVTPIRTATNKAGKTIIVGECCEFPGDIAITADGKTAYVAILGDVFAAPGLVAPIHTATNTVGKHIEVPKWPGAIALTPNGKTLYAASNSSNTVTPIRTATNKPGKAIKVGKGPGAIAITPNGKTAYTANYLDGTVTPIWTANNKAGKAIKVGKDPVVIAIA